MKVSPFEQVLFLRKLVNRQLPVTPHAFDMTMKVVETTHLPNGRDVQGKTGTAFPRLPDGSFDERRAYGWFVGWTTKDGRTLFFARLNQDDAAQPVSGGLRARDAFLAELPALAERLRR